MKLEVGDKITVIWNTEELPMELANGHYPNEYETVTVESEDDEFWYCTNTVEIDKTSHHIITRDQFGDCVVFDHNGELVVGFNTIEDVLEDYPDAIITYKTYNWEQSEGS